MNYSIHRWKAILIILLLVAWDGLLTQEKRPVTKPLEQPVLQKAYQVIIVGGGPSGLSCGQRCAKYGFSTLVINPPTEKNSQTGLPVPNWPGLPNSSWVQIIDLLKSEFIKAGGTYFEGKASSIMQSQNQFSVAVGRETLRCDICVIATGKQQPEIECTISPLASRIFKRFYNPDFLHPKETVALIGDDEHTLQIALEISNLGNKVFIFSHTAALDVESASMEALLNAQNVQFISYDKLLGISNQMKNCLVEYSKNSSRLVQNVSWVVFTDIVPPQSAIAERLTMIDSKGAIVTYDSAGATPTPGLYACGEVTTSEFLSGVFASASGARTGANLCRELVENGVAPVLKPKLKAEEIIVEKEPEVVPSTK